MFAYKQHYIFKILTDIASVLLWVIYLINNSNEVSIAVPMIILFGTYLIIDLWGLYNWTKNEEESINDLDANSFERVINKKQDKVIKKLTKRKS